MKASHPEPRIKFAFDCGSFLTLLNKEKAARSVDYNFAPILCPLSPEEQLYKRIGSFQQIFVTGKDGKGCAEILEKAN